MKEEEEFIKQKINSLNDIDLAFNTSKGWEKLAAQRKPSKRKLWPVLSRLAALLIVAAAIWLLVSKLMYLPKTEVSIQQAKPTRTIQPEKPATAHLPEKAIAPPTEAKKERKTERKIPQEPERKMPDIELARAHLSALLPSPATLIADDIIKAAPTDSGKKTALRIVHLNEIQPENLHPSSKKQKTFYVRVGSESIKITSDQKPKSMSYIIRQN